MSGFDMFSWLQQQAKTVSIEGYATGNLLPRLVPQHSVSTVVLAMVTMRYVLAASCRNRLTTLHRQR